MASLVLSALTFASVTVGVKYLGELQWPTFTVAWGRFGLGFLFLLVVNLINTQKFPVPNNWKLVSIRAFTNFIAVSFFYFSIYFTTLVKANLLNMTYPVFIAFLAPILLNEKTAKSMWAAVGLCFFGILMVLGFEVDSWAIGDLYGLVCGALASVSIMSLRAARIQDDSNTILFYVMLFGAIGLAPFIEIPENLGYEAIGVFILCSFGGLLGQIFLTYSYGYVTAITGAVTGTVRVLFSAVFGVLFFSESISLSLVIGAGMIVLSIYWIQKAGKKS